MQWAKQDYHDKFLDWLQEQSELPVRIKKDHYDLVMGMSRSNTFKEIRSYLIDQERKAALVLDREQYG